MDEQAWENRGSRVIRNTMQRNRDGGRALKDSEEQIYADWKVDEHVDIAGWKLKN